MKLDDPGAGAGDLGRIHIGVNIRLHDADAHFVPQGLNGTGKGGGFAAAGGGHQVQQEGVLLFQLPAQLIRLVVVGLKYALFDLVNFIGFHGFPSSFALNECRTLTDAGPA